MLDDFASGRRQNRGSLTDLPTELRSIIDRDAEVTYAAEAPVTSATLWPTLAGAG